MLGANDFRGVYAIIPTPSKPGADRWDAVDTVDLDETARVIDRLLADGVHGLIVLGTTGECATLTPSEYEAFVACVLATVRKRAPTVPGARPPRGGPAHPLCRRARSRRHSVGAADVAAAHRRYGGGVLPQHLRRL